jgi:hypothetical protein
MESEGVPRSEQVRAKFPRAAVMEEKILVEVLPGLVGVHGREND